MVVCLCVWCQGVGAMGVNVVCVLVCVWVGVVVVCGGAVVVCGNVVSDIMFVCVSVGVVVVACVRVWV